MKDIELQENERLDGDMIYCTKCGGKKLYKWQVLENEQPKYFRIPCNCEKEQKAKEEYERERNKRIAKIRKKANIPTRYQDIKFNKTSKRNEETFDNALKRCIGYCNNAREVLEHGWGIYLYGDKGTGKTHLTACIANDLIENCYKVVFTNFFEITKGIKATYNSNSYTTEAELIDKLAKVDFLIIDDIGTESLKKNGEDTWIQEKIYDVLNKRYNERKPIIFTSNDSLPDLVNKRGMLDKTVDRIMEMSTMILKIEGKSFRRKIRKVELPF